MSIPYNLSYPVVTSTINWMQLVVDSWGEEWAKWDVAYHLEGGDRLSTDSTNRGIYGIYVGSGILLDPMNLPQYQDMYEYRLLQDPGMGAVDQ